MKKNIERWIQEAKNRYRLNAWNFTVLFDIDKGDTLMSVNCTLKYFEAVVRVNLGRCILSSDSEVRFTCYHELAHVVEWKLTELAEDRYATRKEVEEAKEEVAQMIARAVLDIEQY